MQTDHATAAPLVTILVLNWNGYDETIVCVDQLLRVTYQNKKIVILDNGSTNDEPSAFRHRYGTQVTVTENKRNLGYGQGNNVGIRNALDAGTEYVLVLNNDTIPSAGFLEPLVAAIQADHLVGAVGPKLLNRDGSIQMECARKFPTLLDQFLVYSWLTSIGIKFFRGRIFRAHLLTDFDRRSPRSVDMISGACMLLSRDCLSRVGLFDPRFFLNGEDMDLCRRIHNAGLDIRYEPASEIVHLRSVSMNKLATKNFIEVPITDFEYYRKHDGLGYALAYRVLASVFMIPQLLVWLGVRAMHSRSWSGFGQDCVTFVRSIWRLCIWRSAYRHVTIAA